MTETRSEATRRWITFGLGVLCVLAFLILLFAGQKAPTALLFLGGAFVTGEGLVTAFNERRQGGSGK
jgi:hypothetical protein